MYKDKLKEKEKFKRYYWNHPFIRLAKAIKKRDKNSKITAKDLWLLAKKQKCKCALTGVKLTNDDISPDHIVPISKGGSSDISNIQLVIKSANLAKHTLSENEFIQLCIDILIYKQGMVPCPLRLTASLADTVAAPGSELNLIKK